MRKKITFFVVPPDIVDKYPEGTDFYQGKRDRCKYRDGVDSHQETDIQL